jgi:hypothetical protein
MKIIVYVKYNILLFVFIKLKYILFLFFI